MFMVKFRTVLLSRASLAAILLCAAIAFAQTTPSADAPPPETFPNTPQQNQKPETTFKVNSNLVSIFFTARDKHNGLIPTLSRSDCSVFEDKQPQIIKDFNAESDLPLTLGILLDTSPSQVDLLPLEQQVVSQFLHQIMRQKDEAFLVTFDVNVDLAQDFTNSVDMLTHALNQAQINGAGGNGSVGIPGIGQGPFPTQGAPKGTLLYDAVAESSQDKLATETGRKALILFTDGQDQGSRTTAKEAIEVAQKANAIVYVVLIADPWDVYYSQGMMYSGEGDMRKLTEATGGRVFDVGNKGRKLQDALDEIQRELRTQYLLSYTPKDRDLDGRFRSVDIKCGNDIKIQARKGYYAIGNMQ